MSNWEKSPFPSKYSIFIQKGETVGMPKMTLGLPKFLPPKTFFKYLQNVTSTKSDQSFMRRVPLGCQETSSMPKIQRRCLQRHKVLETEC